MAKEIGKSHRQYIEERMKRQPGFREAYAEAKAETAFALALTEMRTQRGLSQRQLADLAGIPQSAIARLERGVHAPSLPTLLRLLRSLNAEAVLNPDGQVILRHLDIGFGPPLPPPMVVGNLLERGDSCTN